MWSCMSEPRLTKKFSYKNVLMESICWEFKFCVINLFSELSIGITALFTYICNNKLHKMSINCFV